MKITRKELITKYLEFFKSNGHEEIKNSSLVPENDPTVLFTTAGMHPLVPYLLGEKHPQGKRLVNVQRCIRTGDIEEVGDTCHHTFFEMLGNWSLGDYLKEDAIKWSFEFLTKELKLPLKNISISVFSGENNIPKDEKSLKIWKSLGVKDSQIKFLGKEDNWWGPVGNTGPCGPDTEMFYKGLEIWNDVFMEYYKNEKGEYVKAEQKNIDTGMGVERTLAVLNGFEDNYLAEVWQPLTKKIEELSGKNYKGNEKSIRIIADHIKASVFIIADGVVPSNSERGYVLRRLIRRTIRYGRNLGLENFVSSVAEPVFEIYRDYEILKDKKRILQELEKEEKKFLETLDKGMNLFSKMIKGKKEINRKDAFLLYQSYGFPIEMTLELAKEKNVSVDLVGFNQENKKHQELSRTASAGVFKSGLADDSESTTRLHTATHLLNQALRIVLKNPNIHQKGSNITPERARFDFAFDRKLTSEEIKQVEDLVNEIIQKNFDVVCEEMSIEEAKKKGAQGIFDSKYGEKVKVYSVGDFSKEICAGPHVNNTSELGKFKISKEESSSAGVRRIKAVLE
jgi:alanyl-tRNA synthetase